MGERLVRNEEVGGSNPLRSTLLINKFSKQEEAKCCLAEAKRENNLAKADHNVTASEWIYQ